MKGSWGAAYAQINLWVWMKRQCPLEKEIERFGVSEKILSFNFENMISICQIEIIYWIIDSLFAQFKKLMLVRLAKFH